MAYIAFVVASGFRVAPQLLVVFFVAWKEALCLNKLDTNKDLEVRGHILPGLLK